MQLFPINSLIMLLNAFDMLNALYYLLAQTMTLNESYLAVNQININSVNHFKKVIILLIVVDTMEIIWLSIFFLFFVIMMSLTLLKYAQIPSQIFILLMSD